MAEQKMGSMVFTQTALRDFAACPRRFQLRYLQRLPWPQAPLSGPSALAIERGRHLHRLIERHLLGIPIDAELIADATLRGWWLSFLRNGPTFPHGRRWQEHRLTIPIDDHYLHGRFDLLIVTESGDSPAAFLYDWKTSRPRPLSALRNDWQTRLYLAMVAESGTALTSGTGPMSAEALTMTYWYAAEPDQPRAIPYSQAEHTHNWALLKETIARIMAQPVDKTWPLTTDLEECRRCAYQVFCGRQSAGAALDQRDESETGEAATPIEVVEPYTP